MAAQDNKIYEDKYRRIVKATDEAILMDNDVCRKGGDMVRVENETQEDKLGPVSI